MNKLNKSLKFFVRIDGVGNIIPSSGQFRLRKPKTGKWKELAPINQCCSTTTTSTSTSSTSTTTSTTTLAPTTTTTTTVL